MNNTKSKHLYEILKSILLTSKQMHEVCLLCIHFSAHRKDFETSQLLGKIEDEQILSAQLQKKIKELQVGTISQ